VALTGGSVEILASRLFPNTYRPSHNILLPFYHNIADVNPAHTRHSFDIPTIRKFTEDVDFLCRHYEPVDLATVIACVESGKSLKKTSFHLTFDDGFRELYDTVAPILIKKGVPATFLVCSNAVDNKSLLLPSLLSLIITAAEKSGRLPPDFLNNDFACFKKHVFSLPWENPGQAASLQDFYEIDAADYLRSEQPFLTANQIHELAGQGFTIGSHSHSHPAFQNIDIDEAGRQAAQSVAFIRDELQLPCESFAFPFYDNNVSKDKFSALAENGIRVSFGTSAPKRDSVGFSLQRFSMNARFSNRSMRDTLRYVSAKAFAYKLLNRQIIQRPAN
jgi:peptidoglycan/xylan/chitin deacetylase (PgdA/CDA1 family)